MKRMVIILFLLSQNIYAIEYVKSLIGSCLESAKPQSYPSVTDAQLLNAYMTLGKIDEAMSLLEKKDFSGYITDGSLRRAFRSHNVPLFKKISSLETFRQRNLPLSLQIVAYDGFLPFVRALCWQFLLCRPVEEFNVAASNAYTHVQSEEVRAFLDPFRNKDALPAMAKQIRLNCALHAALDEKKWPDVWEHVASGASLTDSDMFGNSPAGKADKVTARIFNLYSRYKDTIWHLMEEQPLLAWMIVKRCPPFLKRGFRNDKGETLLHHAMRLGNMSLIVRIFALNCPLIKETNNKGETPLDYALERELWDFIRPVICDSEKAVAKEGGSCHT